MISEVGKGTAGFWSGRAWRLRSQVSMSMICVALLLISACSAVPISPKPKGQQLMVTPVTHDSAQLIVSQGIQQKVIRTVPVGEKWKSIDVDVLVGVPLTTSLASYTASLFPSVRIGDKDDGLVSSTRLELIDVSIVIGTDDSTAHNAGMLMPLALFAMDADVLASMAVTADVSFCGGEAKRISVTGQAVETMNYSKIGLPEFERLMASAIDDSARLLIEHVADGYHSCPSS